MNTLHIDVSLAHKRLHQSPPNFFNTVCSTVHTSVFHFQNFDLYISFYTINLLFQALQHTWKTFTAHWCAMAMSHWYRLYIIGCRWM